MAYTYKYPRMLVTVDIIVFLNNNILLIQRKNEPFKGFYALPGGFVEMNETLKEAASRELFEETGLKGIELTQLSAFDEVDRDPRDRNISIVFYGFTTNENSSILGGDDAENAQWISIDNLPKLAFDHNEIIEYSKRKVSNK